MKRRACMDASNGWYRISLSTAILGVLWASGDQILAPSALKRPCDRCADRSVVQQHFDDVCSPGCFGTVYGVAHLPFAGVQVLGENTAAAYALGWSCMERPS